MTRIATWEGRAVSVNRARLPARGRLISNPAYKRFVRDMAWLLTADRTAARGSVRVRLDCTLPARMDVDNVIKPCLDAMQLAGVIVNDNQVKHVEAVRVGTGNAARITFRIEEVL